MTYDIFIVEDNPTKHEEIKAALPSSCIPTWTTAISQAFKILENKRWDLIILDMTFQVLSGSGNEIAKEPLAGIEVLQYLKRRRIEVPVIVATQHSSFTSNERPDIDSIDKLHAMLARLFSPNYRETVRVDLSEDTWKAGLRLAVVRALGGSSLRILVVDDGETKRRRVVSQLNAGLDIPDLQISEAKDYEEALEHLKSGFFDLVVLDLVLPAADQDPSALVARSLIRQVTTGGKLTPPTHIIGLTQFAEIAKAERRFYDANLLALEFYDENGTDWSEKILDKIKYLYRSKRASAAFSANNFDLDVVILTARHKNEYIPVKSKIFSEVDDVDHPLWKGEVTFGAISLGQDKRLNAALICVGEMGMAATAAVTAQAISVFRPRLIAMLGMCCGFAVEECASPCKFMDVIVVREVSCWEQGKYVEQDAETTEFKNRAKPRLVDDIIRDKVDLAIELSEKTLNPALKRISSQAKFKAIKEKFGEDVRELPEVRFAPIVTGSSVIADEGMISEICSRHPSAIGLDMEVFGLYAAAERSVGKRPSVLAIKGVADFGHVAKDDFGQAMASTISAEVFKNLLPHLGIFD